ncbi:hypothetical protein [Streptomyces halobius]|uniref:Uncharacterized protein n=1 Tax=Streptomyces halobius TaxID=2879846 RepID=A0ABY4M172_9ACTN|nr:hypothetical protein [Streptomyces halobius]UQA91497.1 hypothetical protein K9S39_06100 [Streptomyces halobius]
MPARTVAPEPEVATIEPTAAIVGDGLGQPVHHVRTGELVGYLTPEKFFPIDQVEKR